MLEQELNQYWKIVVDTIQDGIMIVDSGGTIVSANKVLEQAGGNQSRAAKISGVTRVTVWNRMKRYRIAAQRTINS